MDHKSALPVEAILSLEIDELIGQLSSFGDHGSFSEPSFSGLVKAFKQVVKTEPQKY